MKTTKIKFLVGLILSLWGTFSYSQTYWYMGGNSDGSAYENLISNTCSTPNHFYAYMGGNGDGGGLETFESTMCGTPNHFFAYMGGKGDGQGVETIENTTCGFPPQFYAYFGGISDGSSMDITAPICPTQPPVASFTASATTICVGQSVTFTDTSTNIPGAWTWTLPGGTPNSSIVQNPTVVYSTAGSYAVTLKAFNYNGNDTKTITTYITVNDYPTITSTTPASRCDAGTVTLKATASAGTLNWYADASGGTALGTGTSFVTPSFSANKTYYVDATNGTCLSARSPVIASIEVVNAPTGNANQTFCGSEKVGSLAITGTNIVWYDASTNGSVVPNNTTLVSGMTYYASQNNGTCESPSRFAVTVTTGACLGTENFVFKEIKIYPNPVTSILNISNSEAMSKIEVTDMLGRTLSTKVLNDLETKIDMSNLPNGTYLIQVTTDNANKTFKVIKK